MSTTSSEDDLISSIPSSTHQRYLHECLALSRNSPPKPTNFRVGALLVSFDSSSSSSSTGFEQGNILSSGYTLELPGNTHAEQCALEKLLISASTQNAADKVAQEGEAAAAAITAENDTSDLPQDLSSLLPPGSNVVLYTSLEPCSKRLSGATPCVQRIIATRSSSSPTKSSSDTNTNNNDNDDRGGGIRAVIFGAKEPNTFVSDSRSCQILTDAGVPWKYMPDIEEEILRVAMEGHHGHDETQPSSSKPDNDGGKGTEAKKETKIDDISPEERRRQEEMPRNPKKRMMELGGPG